MYVKFLEARLAQRLEHRICNAMVIGSIPIAGFFRFFFGQSFYFIYIFLKSKNKEKNKIAFLFFKTIFYVVETSNEE